MTVSAVLAARPDRSVSLREKRGGLGMAATDQQLATLQASIASIAATLEAREKQDDLTRSDMRELRQKLDQIPQIVADMKMIEQRLTSGTQRMQAADATDQALAGRVAKLENILSALITQIRTSRWLLIGLASGLTGLAMFANLIIQELQAWKAG